MVMATAGSPDNKSIFITVSDTTKTQRKVASGGGGSDGGTTESKEGTKQEKRDKDNKKSLTKLVGIELSLGAMLKQSQIFTGFLGSTFQLIGAFVDILFAPLAPFLFKMVEVIAKYIPIIGQWSKAAVDWLKVAVSDLARLYEKLSGTPITPEEFVAKGFKFISLQGFAMMLGQKFAAALKPGFNWGDTFADFFKESDLVKHIGDVFNESENIQNLKGAFKTLLKTIMKGWMGKFIKALKGFGWVAILIGTVASGYDILTALQEGRVGEAIVEFAWFLISVGIPIAVAFIFGGFWVLLASIIVAAAYMAYEFLIPQSWRDSVNEFFENLYYEIAYELEGIFGSDKEFWTRMGNLTTILVETLKWATGFKILEIVIARINEQWITQINDWARLVAESIINGMVLLVNGILDKLDPTGLTKSIGGRVPMQDLSDWHLLDFEPQSFAIYDTLPPGGIQPMTWEERQATKGQ